MSSARGRQLLKEVVRILEAEGATKLRHARTGSDHQRVYFEVCGRKGCVTIGLTPGKGRSWQNSCADARRTARNLRVQPDAQAAGRRS